MMRVRVLSTCMAMLALAGGAAAEPRWLHEVMAVPDPPGIRESAVVLLSRVELVVDAKLHAERHERTVIRILEPGGLDFAAFSFVLEPGARVKQLRAWTAGHGRILEVGRDQAIESSYDPEGYSDTKQIHLSAPSARVGDVVAVEMTAQEQLPFPFYRWFPQVLRIPVVRAELALDLPEGGGVTTHSTGTTVGAPVTKGRHREWLIADLPGIELQEDSPPLSLVIPRLDLRLTGLEVTARFADWKSVASWYHELAADEFSPAAAPSELAAHATSSDPIARLASLAREVQHSVNYAAIELGLQRWEPDAARDTWARRYGDCKDKATLLVAVLGQQGIEARPVLACLRDHYRVDPEWPSPDQFDHCIVAIAWPTGSVPAAVTTPGPSGKRWTFFDPTATHVPLGLLPAALSGTWAVIADPAEGLVRLPDMEPGHSNVGVRARMEEDGTITGTLEIEARGLACGRLEAGFATATEDDKRERIQSMLNSPAARTEVRSVRWSGVDSTAMTASVVAEFRAGGLAREAGERWLIRPLLRARGRSPARDGAQPLPLWLGTPGLVERRIELTLPSGMRVEETPAGGDSCAAGEYRLVTEVEDGRVTIVQHLVIRDDLVEAARFDETRALLTAIGRGENAPIVLRR